MPKVITDAELTTEIGVGPESQAALGRVCVWSAKVDHELSRCIWHLAKLSEAIGAAFTTSHRTVSGRLGIFKTLIPLVVSDEKDRQKLLSLEKAITAAFEERNRCVHDEIYFYSPAEETAGLIKPRYKVIADKTVPAPEDLFATMSPTSLNDLVHRLIRILARLQQYMMGNGAWKDDAVFP